MIIESTYFMKIGQVEVSVRRERKTCQNFKPQIMTTYRLLIAIEHALPSWPLVDFRKKSAVLSCGLQPGQPSQPTGADLPSASPSERIRFRQCLPVDNASEGA